MLTRKYPLRTGQKRLPVMLCFLGGFRHVSEDRKAFIVRSVSYGAHRLSADGKCIFEVEQETLAGRDRARPLEMKMAAFKIFQKCMRGPRSNNQGGIARHLGKIIWTLAQGAGGGNDTALFEAHISRYGPKLGRHSQDVRAKRRVHRTSKRNSRAYDLSRNAESASKLEGDRVFHTTKAFLCR